MIQTATQVRVAWPVGFGAGKGTDYGRETAGEGWGGNARGSILFGGLTAVYLPIWAVLFVKNDKAQRKQAALRLIPGIAGHYGAVLSIRF
jgi:hypothetical protein